MLFLVTYGRHRGFTLIELLVVVALMAMLVGLLLPALAHSRNAGRVAVCASQARQFALMLPMYTADYKDRFFPYVWSDVYLGLLADYHQNILSLRFCPNARYLRPGPGWGSATEAWIIGHGRWKHDGSYGFNGYLYQPTKRDGQREHVEPRSLYPGAWYTTLSGVEFVDAVPAFADANWIDGWPTDQDTVPDDLRTGWDDFAIDWPTHMGRFCIARHGRAVNVAFLDGHAAITPLRKLWDLQWSRVFVRREKEGL